MSTPKKQTKGKQHAARAASFKRIAVELVRRAKAARSLKDHSGEAALLDVAQAMKDEAAYLRSIVR